MLGISFTSTPGLGVQKQFFISERAVRILPLNTKSLRVHGIINTLRFLVCVRLSVTDVGVAFTFITRHFLHCIAHARV